MHDCDPTKHISVCAEITISISMCVVAMYESPPLAMHRTLSMYMSIHRPFLFRPEHASSRRRRNRLLMLHVAAALMPRLMHRHMPRLPPTRRRGQRPVRVRVVVVIMRPAITQIDPDIVVRELAHLRVVDAEDLGLLGRAQAHAGDEVEEPEDDGGHDEGVGHARDRVCDLVAELDVVVVEPAAGDGRAAVEARDAGLGEEACEDVADEPADGVRGEDLRQ